MALTITTTGDYFTTIGNKNLAIATVAFTGGYTSGGDTLQPSDLGMRTFEYVTVSSPGGYTMEYDASSGKIKAYYGDYTAASAGALIEVPNATVLPDVSILAIGI